MRAHFSTHATEPIPFPARPGARSATLELELCHFEGPSRRGAARGFECHMPGGASRGAQGAGVRSLIFTFRFGEWCLGHPKKTRCMDDVCHVFFFSEGRNRWVEWWSAPPRCGNCACKQLLGHDGSCSACSWDSPNGCRFAWFWGLWSGYRATESLRFPTY